MTLIRECHHNELKKTKKKGRTQDRIKKSLKKTNKPLWP
jgi:hypothetical protein